MNPARGLKPAPQDYVIRGGHEGKRRLELLGRTMWPTTFQLLKRTGIREGMVCADLGCGGGDATLGIARMVGPSGRVAGIDMDGVKLAAAQEEAARQGLGNVEFREGNVCEWSEEAAYDRIFSRFLLTHLADPAAALDRIRHALRPGGLVVIEDIDFTGSFCYPRCPAYERYVELYRGVVLRRKADPDIGLKLHGLLVRAGFPSVNLSLTQPFGIDQEGKGISLSTLVNIREAVLAEGLADAAEMDRAVAELEEFTNDPTTLIGGPRIFQAWGRRA